MTLYAIVFERRIAICNNVMVDGHLWQNSGHLAYASVEFHFFLETFLIFFSCLSLAAKYRKSTSNGKGAMTSNAGVFF